jgi:membrane fusion protein (multidrug efflux system)
MKGVKKLIVIVAAFGLAIGGFFAREHLLAGEKPTTEGKASLGESNTPPPVQANTTDTPLQTAKVEVLEEDTAIRLTGSLAADERSDIAPNVGGIVDKIFVDRGSVVEKGEVLVQVDSRDAKNMLAEGEAGLEELKAALGMTDPSAPYKVDDHPAVKMAKAALDLTDINFKRFTDLHEKGAISRAAFDQSRTEHEAAVQRHQQALYQARQLYQSYHTAQAKIDMLKKNLLDTTIIAPFSGWVAEKYVSPGERVSTMPGAAGGKICTLVKLDPLRLILTVPQQSIGLIKQGQKVEFTVDSFPDRIYTGEIHYIGTSLENMSRSLTIEAIVPNPDKTLRPGFFATARVVLPEKIKKLTVSQSTIMQTGDVAKVFVVRDGKAREQIVYVGAVDKEHTHITSGLTADDVVITTPWRVRDGDVIH